MRRLSCAAGSPPSLPRCCFILCAVCQVWMITSPTRPIACESDESIENAPKSCRMSSAAIVSPRSRASGKATSSAISGSRGRYTNSMSRSSSMAFTVCCRVDLFDQRRREARIAFAEKAEVHRERLGGFEHALNMPRAGCASRRESPCRRSRTSADHGRDAGHQRFLDLLGTDEMDVRIDSTCGDDRALAGDDLRAGADHDIDRGLDVRIAGLAELRNSAVLDRDVALHDAPPVDDQRIGDHRVGAVPGCTLALAHAVADDLAAAELDFLPVDGKVALDLDDQIRIREPHAVADGRAEHLRVSGAPDLHRSLRFAVLPARFVSFSAFGFFSGGSSGPMTAPRNPYTMRAPASATSSTVRFCPGSKRTAVPAAMLRRWPRAASRSNARAAFVSAK